MAEPMVPRPRQITADQPALATAAPTKPPTRAWLLLDGMPSRQVITFQAIAPDKAPKMTAGSTMPGSTTPLLMAAATCRPNTAKAMKLKNAAHSTAAKGRNTRVATTVAMELALSCRPFRKPNSRATAIRPASTGVPTRTWFMGKASSDLLDDDAVDHVHHVLAAVHHGLDQVIDLLDRQLVAG